MRSVGSGSVISLTPHIPPPPPPPPHSINLDVGCEKWCLILPSYWRSRWDLFDWIRKCYQSSIFTKPLASLSQHYSSPDKTSTDAPTCTHTSTHIYIHAHTCTYMHRCTHLYTYKHTHIHTCTYMHIHAHTCTYMHIHAQMQHVLEIGGGDISSLVKMIHNLMYAKPHLFHEI